MRGAQPGFVDQDAVTALRTGEKLFILPEVLFGDTEVLFRRQAQQGGALFDALDGFLVEVHVLIGGVIVTVDTFSSRRRPPVLPPA